MVLHREEFPNSQKDAFKHLEEPNELYRQKLEKRKIRKWRKFVIKRRCIKPRSLSLTDFVTQAFERKKFCNVTDNRLRRSKNRRPIGPPKIANLSSRGLVRQFSSGLLSWNSEVDSNLRDQEEASLILTELSSSGPAVSSEAPTLLT